MTRLNTARMIERHFRANYPSLESMDDEVGLVYFLGSTYDLVGMRLFNGSGDTVQIPPEAVARSAASFGARHAVVVHSHPHSSAAVPSSKDLKLLTALKQALAPRDVGFLDFVIVSQGSMYSARRDNAALFA